MKKLLCCALTVAILPATVNAYLITFTCNCGAKGKAAGMEFAAGGKKCTSSNQTRCIVSETYDGFVLRADSSYALGEPACSVCGCPYVTEGDWTSSDGTSVSKTISTTYDASTYECAVRTEVKTGCNRGYYFYEEDKGAIKCERCPMIYDDWVDCYGESEIGNRNGITGCFISSCSNITDETGTYSINGKCYHDAL